MSGRLGLRTSRLLSHWDIAQALYPLVVRRMTLAIAPLGRDPAGFRSFCDSAWVSAGGVRQYNRRSSGVATLAARSLGILFMLSPTV